MTQENFTLRTNFTLLQSTGRREFKARFVRAGRIRGGGNKPANVIIEPAALKAAAEKGMFEGKAVFLDHAGFFQYPSVKNLAGVTLNASWNEADQSVDGTISFYDTAAQITDLVDELLSDSNPPDIGLSIVFWPKWAPRDNDSDPRRIVEVLHVESVDLVFEPAADGRILQALSTYFQNNIYPVPTEHLHQQYAGNNPLNPLSKSVDSYPTQGESFTMTSSTQPPVGAQDLRPEPAPQSVQSVPQSVDSWLPAMASIAASQMIASSGLPGASQDRLRSRQYATPADVNTAIDEERAYLAALASANVVQIGGQAPRGSNIQVGMDGIERLQLALEALINGSLPPSGVAPLTGIREAYMLLSGDYEMTGLFHSDRIQFANVTSATMANLVANALNKVIVNQFQEYPRWWEKIVSVQDFSSLQQVKWITLGGVGELPTVAEGAGYTELTWDDMAESSTFVKKGGYLGLTLEAIDKDDTRKIQAAPRALAQAAWLTLSKSISAIFTDNSGVGPTLGTDSTALFHTNHGNLGTTALSMTQWAAIRLAMRKQTELNSSERLGGLIVPKFLLVPPDLEITALQILASEYDYTYALSNAPAAPSNVLTEGNDFSSRLSLARDRVIVVDMWTDTNNYAAVADPRLYPSIGLGFRYGRTPEIFSIASPTAGLMFTNDTMPVKVRYFYAVGPTDYRGLYKCNVA
jgi:hypothetical protein